MRLSIQLPDNQRLRLRTHQPPQALRGLRSVRANLQTVALLALIVGLSGCEANKPDAGKNPQTKEAAAPAQPDDAEAVASLQQAKAELKMNKAGNAVEQVDLQPAGGGNVELFKALAKLPSLRAVICTGPDVSSEAVALLKGHPRLEKLAAVDRSSIGDAGIEALVSVPNLMDLTLERSEITDAAYANLAKMKKLRYLRAPLTKTTDAGVKQLADAVQIELLDFRDCTGVSDEGVTALNKLTKIRSFKVWGRQITDKSLKVFGQMTNMATLGLQDTAVTGSAGELSGLTKLTDLDVFRSTFTDEGLKSIAGAKGMRNLKLRDCKVTAEGLKLLSGFPNLERLDLSESRADDSTLEAIKGASKLFDLDLWLSHVTDAGLVNLVNLPLKSLSLEDVYDISDAGMEHVGKIKTLESLTLTKVSVTDDGLAKLAGLENLKELYLDNTTVSKKGVDALKAKLPKLTKVSF